MNVQECMTHIRARMDSIIQSLFDAAGKYPKHREPLVRGLRCLGKVWKEPLRRMLVSILSGQGASPLRRNKNRYHLAGQ